MRPLFLMLVVSLSLDAWVNSASADTNVAHAKVERQLHTECLGRTQFEVFGDIEWHVAGGHWNFPKFGIYSPNIDPSDKQLSYGDSPFKKDGFLFDIEVSPKTTLAIFQQLKDRHGPDVEGAQTRVIENKVSAIKQRLTWELEQNNPQEFKSLKSKQYALEDDQKHLTKLHSKILILEDEVETFEESGRPTEKLKAELKVYQKELNNYPTDPQYEQERYVDWNIPEAQITWTPGKLTALLWRNERIYRFTATPNISGLNTEQTLKTIEPKAREILQNFRAREQFEIPQEPGFCLPFGYISDNGTDNYAITLAWHPINNSNLLYSLSLSNKSDKGIKLLPLLTSSMFANPFPSAVELNRFGPEPTKIGTVDGVIGGSRYQGINPETGKIGTKERFTLTAGHTNSETGPALVLKVESFTNDQPLSFENVKDQLIHTLESVRPLPGITRKSSSIINTQ